ncbi:MAG TPA: PadR family transcriptional regulator [Ktedonobacteraceae bacterium]|jgi:DNA-binding PadR family transcriptional regulator
MFRRFAYQFAGDPDSWGPGWTPPWLQDRPAHGPFGPLHFARRMRGPFGGRFGPGGFFGHGDGERFFGRGDVKYALLELLRERPMYGYEMIKALEEKSGGFYTPSPGSIYPTLQMLEERGFVTSEEVEGKKVYRITDTGRALLEERPQQGFFGPPWMHHHHGRGEHFPGPRPEIKALRQEAMEVARLFALAGRGAINDPEKATRLRSVIARARKDLAELVYGESGSSPQAPTAPPEQPSAE